MEGKETEVELVGKETTGINNKITVVIREVTVMRRTYERGTKARA